MCEILHCTHKQAVVLVSVSICTYEQFVFIPKSDFHQMDFLKINSASMDGNSGDSCIFV